LEIDVDSVETNIIFFQVRQPGLTVAQLLERLRADGVLMGDTGATGIRAVTHLNVSKEDIEHAVEVLRQAVN
jgi:threonine aldolase